jgi:CheY-like chemotaxis protein
VLGGSLRVVSAPGAGAEFTLRVPVRILQPEEASLAAARHAADAEQSEAAARASQAAAVAALALPAPATSGAGAASGASKRKLRCLLADDHPLNLRLVTRLMELDGFEVRAVPDGAAALDALKASYEPTEGEAPYDVAVLDMQMPRLTGPEAASAFRAWERAVRPTSARLPIAALTANVLEEHAEECKAAGMDIFLSKPLRKGALVVVRAMAQEHARQCGVEP